ncbi:MAG: DNA translocase FtsK [Clostridia bacterium]|nr:DNA translocase FtsK [Clostridia bacterium]
MFVIGIRLALHNLKRSFLVTNITGLICVGCISGFFHIMNYSTLIGDFTEWKNQLVDAAKVSFAVPGFKPYGGIIGAVFGGAPLQGFGKPGATITLLGAFLVCLYFYLNIDRNTFGDAVSKTINDSKDKLSDTNEQLKIKNEERRKLRSEEKATRMALAAEKARELAEKEQRSNDAFDFNETKIENDPDKFAEDADKVTYKVGDSVFTYPANYSAKSPEKPQKNPAAAKANGGFISSGAKQPVNIFAEKKKPAEPEAKPDVSLHHDAPVQEIDFGDFTEIVTDDAELSEDASEIVKDAIATAKANRQKNIDEVKNYVEKDKKAKEYKLPPVDCLNAPKFENNADFTDEMQVTAKKLVEVLMSFGVETRLIGASRGPSVTRYELSPAPGVKISKITNLSDDIALGLASTGVRIEAPIPNKAAVGIEVPNRSRSTVTFREMISSKEFKNNGGKLLNVALGKDIAGNICCADLSKMPHLLIAGTTGSGKSVCLNGMIASILYNATPEQVKLLMIDPKQVEFTVYNGIPHLLVPVITDARKAAGSLAWAVGEMENRYKAFTQFGVRDISSFNKYAEKHPEIDFMPQIVLFIDELNDLMMVSPKEVEDSICRLAQKARAAGMHLVVATQRPSVDVITGIIKANIPSRISLSVSSQVDSRTILDSIGAEKLLGNGDMLFAPVGVTKPVRIQGAYLSDEEIGNIVSYIKNQVNAEYDDEIMQEIEKNAVAEASKKKGAAAEIQEDSDGQYDSLIDEALNIITQLDTASTTVLQRKLRVGYARAARIVDELEELGYISSPTGNNKARNVLISRNQYLEMKAGTAQTADDFDVLSD